ncbi:MAG: DUF3843 family protein [Bacteroidales bacterium]
MKLYELARVTMDVFEDVWEYAPENKYLKEYCSIAEDEMYFYRVRHLVDSLRFGTYLFYPDTYQI